MLDKKAQTEEVGEKFNIWSSYSDMYCSLLMIFMLLFFVVVLQYLQMRDINAEETAKAQEEFLIDRSVYEKQIVEKDSALTEYEKENERLKKGEEEYLRIINTYREDAAQLEDDLKSISRSNDELLNEKSKLENLNSELENRNSELALQNNEYARMNVELERNNEELLQERSLLEEQKREVETLLMEVSDRLTVTEYSIKEKAELTDKIMLLLQNELMVRGVSYEMNADHDAFVFYVDELYDEDRIQLSDEGRAMVSAFFKAYIEILLTSEYKDRLDLFTFVCVMPNEGVYRMNVNYGIKYASDTASYCASAYERAKDIYDRLFISTHVDNNAEKSIIELGFTLNTVE